MYQVYNGRDLDVKIVVQYNGNNLRVIPGPNFIVEGTRVEGYLKKGEKVKISIFL